MLEVSIRLSEEERKLINETILEYIEDECDLKVAEKAHEEWVDFGRKTVSIEEIKEKYL